MAQDQDFIARVLTCGSVDDGKSTLIGHLLHLTGNLHDDQLLLLQKESAGSETGAALDYSLLLDGLMAEREQGITIDVAYRYFATARRKFIVADSPGHERYTRNMATAASQCAGALLLVDIRHGIMPQTRRHALICGLMGIRRLLFVVNKMDTVAWDEQCFVRLEQQCATMAGDLERFGLQPPEFAVAPVSALHGDNLVAASPNMPWYAGQTVLAWLEESGLDADNGAGPLRMPVEYVIKGARSGGTWQNDVDAAVLAGTSATYRAYAGTLVSGVVRVGDQVALLPSGVTTTVAGILAAGCSVTSAVAPLAVSLTLDGEHDISRGECLSHSHERPEVASQVKARLVWMDESPLFAGRRYLFRSVCGTATAEAAKIRNRIDLTGYQRLAVDKLELNDIGEIELSLSRQVPCDPYERNREMGGFILIDQVTNATAACGMILHPLRRAANVYWSREVVGRADRSGIKGQKPCVVWLTGLSGSGKSTIANALEQRLHGMGRHTMLLDGDNIRHGLNKDLGFTEADRVENIRRLGEVAKLMTDAGLIVITAFISPYRAERDMVRGHLAEGEFIEVHVSTPLEVCEQRDPKGLYLKARRGEIPNFTGISAPYEVPGSPEITLDTSQQMVQESAEMVIDFLISRRVI
jgi:bifunctional enzyme CysN/CysC